MARRKRGVSPLIATVLLIAFAVALGAVVMNWGRSYAQETADTVRDKSDKDVKCAVDTGIELVKLNDVPQLCYGGASTTGFLYFIVRNTGSKDIEQLGLEIFGANELYSNSSLNGSSIVVAASNRQNVTYDFDTYGAIDSVVITPHIKVAGTVRACTGNTLQKGTADILNCSA